jgi:hypothetical protein
MRRVTSGFNRGPLGRPDAMPISGRDLRGGAREVAGRAEQ